MKSLRTRQSRGTDDAFSVLLRAMLAPACAVDVDSGRLIDANLAFAALLGERDVAPLLGRSDFWVEPADPQRFIERSRLARVTHFESAVRDNRGREVPVFVAADRAGPICVVQIEEPGAVSPAAQLLALGTSAQSFAAIFGNSPVPTALVDHRTGELVAANPALEEMSTARSAPMVGVNTATVWVDADAQAQFAALLREHGKVKDFEAELYRANGAVLPVSINCQVLDIDGNLYRLAQFIDLSERREHERRLLNAMRRLEQAQALARLGDFIYDPETRELSGSPQLHALLAQHPDATLDVDRVLGLVHRDDRRRLLKQARLLTRPDGEADGGLELSADLRVEVDAGGVRHHRVIARAAHRAARRPLLVGTVQDVTDQREAERERLAFESKVQEAQRLESLGVLSAGIAHDFNNLLSGVMGNTELALMERLPEAARNYLEEVRSAAQRAADLTRQLLAYSGQARTVFETVDVDALVADMAQLLQRSVSDNCALEVRLAGARLAIEADPRQIRQVLVNLVINACEAIDRKRGEVLVRTGELECLASFFSGLTGGETFGPGRYAYLEVVDNGSGMDASVRTRIFEPFFTTKFAGRGLGLAAVLGILRNHKAAIKIDSEPGRGTSIAVYFPLLQQTNRADVAPVAAARHVLVIDDEPAVRNLLQSVLEKFGFRAVLADGGRAGIVQFERLGADVGLVLLDMSMPEMDGVATLERLRALDPRVNVLVMSGYSEEDTLNRFHELGVDGFIAKPFAVGDVVQRVHAVLGERPKAR